MATKRGRKVEKKLASRGDASGFARIRLWSCAIETAMIARYIGNAPTLRALRAVVKTTIRDINRIKPALMSDCPGDMAHKPNCVCYYPPI